MYKYVSYDEPCVVMKVLIIQTGYSLREKLFLCLAVLVVGAL